MMVLKGALRPPMARSDRVKTAVLTRRIGRWNRLRIVTAPFADGCLHSRLAVEVNPVSEAAD